MTAVGHLQLRRLVKHVAEGDAGDCSYNEMLFSGSLLPFPFGLPIVLLGSYLPGKPRTFFFRDFFAIFKPHSYPHPP